VAAGAGEALRAAGLALGIPILTTGDRVLFIAGTTGLSNLWEIRLSPGSWRVQGVPHQRTFGMLSETPYSISGMGALSLLCCFMEWKAKRTSCYQSINCELPTAVAGGTPDRIVSILSTNTVQAESANPSAFHP
jgi:hypothetical protein